MKIIFIGVGKSYDVARLGANLVASVGQVAFSYHATELLHGGLGVIENGDVIVAITHSGKTEETMSALNAISGLQLDVDVQIITGNRDVSVYKNGLVKNVHYYDIERESSRHNTVPYHSIIKQLAIINDVFVEPKANTTSRTTLGSLHPGGSLGEIYNA